MNDSSIITVLGLSPEGAAFDDIARAFINHVKSSVQKGTDSYDDLAVKKEEDYLRGLFPQFFEFTIYWIRDEIARNKDVKNHSEAVALKNQARSVLQALQDNIIEYTVVYMRINRFMTLVRDEIKGSGDKSIFYDSNKKIKWTGDTGIMLGRNKKRKAEISALMAKHDIAIPIVENVEAELKYFYEGLLSIFSKEEAEKTLTSVRAALRVANFSRAKTVIGELSKKQTRFSVDRKSADAVIADLTKKMQLLFSLLEENQQNLTSEDQKLFLASSEMRIVQDSLKLEARKIRVYIVKYNLPYMEYKLEYLSLLHDKLLIVGSLDSLMTLYLRLVSGIAQPMSGLQDVRQYEADVLGPIKFLQGGQFAEIPKILDDAIRTIGEFRHVRQEYQDELAQLTSDADAAELMQNMDEE